MSQHTITIAFDSYEIMPDSTTRKYYRWMTVPFGPKTTEYENNKSYDENMERFVYDCFENGFLFVSDTLAVPVFEIHGFYDEKDNTFLPSIQKEPVQTSQPVQPVQKGQQVQSVKDKDSYRDSKKIRHRHRKHHGRSAASVQLPFQVQKDSPSQPVNQSIDNTDNPS